MDNVRREEAQRKLDNAISKLAEDNDIIDYVKAVEGSIATTKGHYGKYMHILGEYNKQGKAYAYVLKEAMIKAGANSYGVNWAYKIITGQE